MFLNAVRVQSLQGKAPILWRLSTGMGALERKIAINRLHEHDGTMLAGFEFVMTGKSNADIQAAAAHLTDPSGHAWVLERSKGRLRILRNGESVDEHEATALICEAVLQQSLSGDSGRERPTKLSQLLTRFDIDLEDGNLSVRSAADNLLWSNRTDLMFSRRKHQILQDCQPFLGQQAASADSVIQSVARKLQPLHQRIGELTRQQKELQAGGLEFDFALLRTLEEHVELLNRIEELAAPILAPGAAPSIIRKRIEELDSKLSELKRNTDLRKLPKDPAQIPWQALIETRSLLDALDHAIRASAETKHVQEERLEKFVVNYVLTVEGLIRNDVEITAELESCLSSLAIRARQAEDQDHVQQASKISTMLTRFLKPEGELHQNEDRVQASQRLEEFRTAVDFALGKLGELHSDLDALKKELQGKQEHAENAYESLVGRFAKARDRWFQLASQHGLRDDLSLDDLIRLCRRAHGLIGLFQRKEDLLAELANRSHALGHLEQLIYKWRQISSSQKDAPLSQESILLSEANALIQYNKKKKQQLEKMREISDQLRAQDSQRQLIQRKLAQTISTWKEVAAHHGIDQPAPQDRSWSNFFEKAQRLAALQDIMEERARPFSLQDGLLADDDLAPFKIFNIRAQNLGAHDCARLIEALKAFSNKGLMVIDHHDTRLTSALQNEEIGTPRIVETPLRRQAAEVAVSRSQIVSAELSAKAKRALDILSNKSSQQKDTSARTK